MDRDWFHRASCVETCLELFFKIAPTQVEAICKGLRIHFHIRDLRRIAGVTNLALGFQNVSSPTWPCFCPLARSRVSCVIARDQSITFLLWHCQSRQKDQRTRTVGFGQRPFGFFELAGPLFLRGGRTSWRLTFAPFRSWGDMVRSCLANFLWVLWNVSLTISVMLAPSLVFS